MFTGFLAFKQKHLKFIGDALMLPSPPNFRLFKSKNLTQKLSFSDFLIPISLQPNVPNLRYIINPSWKYQRFTPSGCKETRITKFVFPTPPLA